MIAPQEVDAMGIQDLIAHEQQNGLNRVVPPVYEIPYKDVFLLWQMPTLVSNTATYLEYF